MNIGVPREERLTSAKETFMLHCKAAGVSPYRLIAYHGILNRFISFTGNMLVRELGPDHVRLFIADLSDQQVSHGALKKYYAVVRHWIRWIYAQKKATERLTDLPSPRRFVRRGDQSPYSIFSCRTSTGFSSKSVSTSGVMTSTTERFTAMK